MTLILLFFDFAIHWLKPRIDSLQDSSLLELLPHLQNPASAYSDLLTQIFCEYYEGDISIAVIQFRIKTQNLKRQSRAESISKEKNQHDSFLSCASFCYRDRYSSWDEFKRQKRRLFRLTFRRFSVPQLLGLLRGNTSWGVYRAEGHVLPW